MPSFEAPPPAAEPYAEPMEQIAAPSTPAEPEVAAEASSPARAEANDDDASRITAEEAEAQEKLAKLEEQIRQLREAAAQAAAL